MVAPVRILVVDDEEQIAQLLAGVLRGQGHEAEYVTDGESALERLRGARFDLLVTDLRMPRMDGMRLIEQAREENPDLDALIMTAYASAETAVGALRQGVSDYLSKPFGVDDIRSAVQKCLDDREQRRREEREKDSLQTQVASTQSDLGNRVADLSFLHDLTRLIAGRTGRLQECLALIGVHFQARSVLITERDAEVRIWGEEPGDDLRIVARRASATGMARLGDGCMAAPVAGGAVAVAREADFSHQDLRLLMIAGRDLALAVENERLRTDQRRVYVGVVSTLIEAVEAKDRFNRGHSSRVAELARVFARHVGFSERECELVETAAKLHDIGKIGIPEEILNKPGQLTESEFDVIKSHPVIGEQILKPLDFLAETRPIVRHHHERWDGAGYPDGLSAGNIPSPAALLAIVDAFDAMTSNRPYRDGMGPDRAHEILRDGAGSQWDPEFVRGFHELR